MRKTKLRLLTLSAVSLLAFYNLAIGEETGAQPPGQPDTSTTAVPAEAQVTSETPVSAESITPETVTSEPVTSETQATPASQGTSSAPASNKKSTNILRALLTTSIVNKEPADEIVSIDKNQDRIYFFTEFADMRGEAVKHRWEYQGKTMAEVNFNVGSSKWRCYSSKNILPEWTGIWTVSVVDSKGEVISENYFEVTE